MHWAACRGHLKVFKYLLNHGGKIFAKDVAGRTPQVLAKRHNKNNIFNVMSLPMFFSQVLLIVLQVYNDNQIIG